LKPRFFSTLVLVGSLALPAAAAAQVTPAKGVTPPDDTPSIKIGVTIFTDYTFQKSPTATDASGNSYSPNAFNVSRSYINITGQISHVVGFRITPDITRVSAPGSNFDGAYGFRLKYAFAQINLDDWMTKGSWIRVGQQQTPWIDFEEGVYRYRFQGPVMVDRAGFITSSDPGVSFHGNFPNNYGDVHIGIYNGEGYSKAETNQEKAVQARFTVRPMATGGAEAKGLRISAFVDADRPVSGGVRNRVIVQGLFEDAHLSLGVDWAGTSDQATADVAKVSGRGFSIWVTPFFQKKGDGWEALLRYDQVKPNTDVDQTRKIGIVGLAYWFPHTGGPQAALLFDYDQQTFPGTVKQQKIGVHALINF
jgi:hypothetical protein